MSDDFVLAIFAAATASLQGQTFTLNALAHSSGMNEAQRKPIVAMAVMMEAALSSLEKAFDEQVSLATQNQS